MLLKTGKANYYKYKNSFSLKQLSKSVVVVDTSYYYLI